jgi:hypothetical protein
MFANIRASYLRTLLVSGLIAATSLTAAWAGPASPPQKTSPKQEAQIVENYGKLPLTFEANRGQADKSVKFLSRGSGYGLYLTENEAALTLCKTVFGPVRSSLQGKVSLIRKSASCDVVRMQLAGASGKASPRGEDRLPEIANYFIGNDPAKWRTSVPTYSRVRYTGIYPGIDLVYYGNQRQLEYDFVVAPGINPHPVRLRFAGAKELRLVADGDLVVTAANGTLAFHKPLVYQVVDGHRLAVAGDFALLAKNTVGFRLGSYDHSKALVIDPVLAYSTYLGGSGQDSATAIAVDATGNAYVTGLTTSIDFPVTQGAFQTTNKAGANSSSNAFVTKLNPTGTAQLYSTYLGGSGRLDGVGEIGTAIAVDSTGNVYVAGQTFSPDFPVTQGAFQTTNRARGDATCNAFVTKLNPTGTGLLYSTYLGGSGNTNYFGDSASRLVVDSSGDAYVTGSAGSPDFPVTQGAFQTTNHAATNENTNAFVTELNPTGTAQLYSTYLGGSGTDRAGDMGNAIAVDTAGDTYVTGLTSSSDFPVTQGAFQTTNKAAANTSSNAFVTELNPTGTAQLYSTYLGGSGRVDAVGDKGTAIAVDTDGNVYVGGYTYSADFPVTQGAFQTTNKCAANKCSNAFVSKLNPTGTAQLFSTFLGGSGGTVIVELPVPYMTGELANALAIDSSGNVYVAGSTASVDFPVTQGAYQTANHDQPGCVVACIGGYNAFITELNSTGSMLLYSTYLGGDGYTPRIYGPFFGEGDQANGLALDGSGNVYVAGGAQSFDFPMTAGAFQTALTSWFINPFLIKLDMSATSSATTPTVTVTPTPSTITSGNSALVTVSVSGGSGNPMPTGAVTLTMTSYTSVPTALSSGSATIDILGKYCQESLESEYLSNTPSASCQDLLAATYIPDAASSSTYGFSSGLGSINVVLANFSVTPSSTTLTRAQSQSQALPVAIVANVGTGNPPPTGAVTLTTGTYSSGATTLVGGAATINIPAGTLVAGDNDLGVSYSGDTNYVGFSNYIGANVYVGTGNPGFALTNSGNITVKAGATTGNTTTITLTPAGGFTGQVNLSGSVSTAIVNPVDPPTCTIASSMTISGAGPATATLTVATTAASSGALSLPPKFFFLGGGGIVLVMLVFLRMPARRHRWSPAFCLLALALVIVGFVSGGCGSNGGNGNQGGGGTTPGAYTVTVTGTDAATGNITSSTTVTINVN